MKDPWSTAEKAYENDRELFEIIKNLTIESHLFFGY